METTLDRTALPPVLKGFLSTLLMAIVILASPTSQATKTFYKSVTLEQLVAASSLIVVAKSAPVPFVKETIDITPKGQTPDDPDKYPPFEKVTHNYVVQEVLFANDLSLGSIGVTKEALVGTTIGVARSDWQEQLELHEKYYLEGVSKSPIVQRYQSDADLNSSMLILFITVDQATKPHYQLAYSGGVEALSKKATVIKTISKVAAMDDGQGWEDIPPMKTP